MKKVFTLIIIMIFCICRPLFAQVDFVKRTIRKMYLDKDSTKKGNFILVPALSSSPETGIEFGGAALYSFYTDKEKNSDTRVSSVYGYASVTTKGQEKTSINYSYWTPHNRIHYTATTSYYNFPFDFYGIGNNTTQANEELIDEKRTRFNFGAQELVAQGLYAGFVSGINKYYYYSGTYDENPEFKYSPDIEDKSGGSLIFLGPALTFDNRNNNTYTTKGLYLNAYLNVMQGIYYNNSYEGSFFNFDYAEFFQLQKSWVLGFNVKEQSLIGDRSPFFLLPQLGNDALMRGYYTGRYRDRNLLAGQTELRYRINDRLGLVGFLGTGEVAHNGFSANQLKPDYGGGLRYFFDTEKGLSIRFDYGIGEKPAGETREEGFYIALGESF
jgi:hypothetical protein